MKAYEKSGKDNDKGMKEGSKVDKAKDKKALKKINSKKKK